MRYYLFAGGVYSLEIIIIVVFWAAKTGFHFVYLSFQLMIEYRFFFLQHIPIENQTFQKYA